MGGAGGSTGPHGQHPALHRGGRGLRGRQGASGRIARAAATRRSSQSANADIKAVYAAALAEMEVLLGDPSLVDQAHELLATLIRRIVLTPEGTAWHGGAPRDRRGGPAWSCLWLLGLRTWSRGARQDFLLSPGDALLIGTRGKNVARRKTSNVGRAGGAAPSRPRGRSPPGYLRPEKGDGFGGRRLSPRDGGEGRQPNSFCSLRFSQPGCGAAISGVWGARAAAPCGSITVFPPWNCRW